MSLMTASPHLDRHATRGGIDHPHVLIVPGWKNSGPNHWQYQWARKRSDTLWLEQEDWLAPDLSNWLAAFDRTLAAIQGPVVIAAHSLGCILTTHALRQASRRSAGGWIAGALLVAPADVDSPRDTPDCLRGFGPIPLDPLPVPSTVVISSNDPHLSRSRGRHLSRRWGSTLVEIGAAGHLNAASGHGEWPEGETLLAGLLHTGQYMTL